MTLIASTLGLLLIVGVAVYGVLGQLVTHDEESQLSADFVDLHESLHQRYFSPDRPTVFKNYVDDLGQHDYFIIFRDNHIAVESILMPIPVNTVKRFGQASKYNFTIYHGEPYRLMNKTFDTHYGTYRVVMYRSIETEERLLRHVITLISEVGTGGMLLAIGFNLWLGNKVLRPARDIWEAQQTLLVELSHELQTPLATMHAVANQVDKPDLRDRLRRETMNASELVSNILYLSKLRVLPKQMFEPVAASDITEEVVERMAPLAERRGVELDGRAEPGVYVLASPETWARLASTIFKNVVDHAAANTTATWTLVTKHNVALFYVENRYDETAPGYQEGQSPPPRFGMTIVRRLVASMDGNIQVDVHEGWFRVHVSVPLLRPS